ncbi:MAG: hypothetical protein GWP91_10575, partial [Rhodobacterales bacterium]|nr:hypothetical protein [Rhodobacterales bacterium]
VEPAAVDHFAVQVLPALAGAGQLLTVQVVGEDAFDNPTEWSGELVPSVSNGGLISTGCLAHPFNVGEYNCDTVATTAGIGLVLDVAGDDGTTGSFSPFVVGPADDVGDIELVVVGTPISGQSFEAQVSVYDSYGNIRHAGQWLDTDYLFDDELGQVSCIFSDVLPTGVGIWNCTLLTARTGAILHVELVSESVGDDADPFQVINGPLAQILVIPESTRTGDPNVVEAGEAFDLRLTALDAHGNPMVVLVDRVLDLTDSSGTLTPSTADLDATGQVVVNGVLTAAGTTFIDAGQFSETHGTSDAIEVLPSSGHAFKVTVVSPWVWVGLSEEIRVEAIDAFDNRVDWTGTATVRSDFTGAADLVVSVTNGVGVGSFVWTTPSLDETLTASGGEGWVGTTVAFDVVEDCGAAGPVSSVSFAGFPEAIACVTPATGLAPVSVSFAGSTQGNAPIARYVIAMNGGQRVSSASTSMVYDLPGVGVHELRGLVLDNAGCAVELSAAGYAGDADGEVVGPIEVTFGDVQIDALVGSTTLVLTNAVDCARDVAVGATVFVRTGLGEVLGATPTGAGLSLVLDAVGSASANLAATTVDSGGDADVHIWVASGAGGAVESLPIIGDSRRPVVWAQNPTGEHLDLVSEVVLTFSEPMRDVNLVPANFSVFGPSTPVILSVISEADDTVARIQLDAPIDGASGTWTVQGLVSLRDRAGNRLGGDWNVAASDYLGVLGDVGTFVDEVFCDSLDPIDGLFRPDGDPGVSGDQDQVLVNLSVALAPAWWEVSVRINTGTLVRRERVVPSGVLDSWAWDGTDQTGRVVDNGVWQIEVEPVDGLGNHGQGCVVNATVDNALGVDP